MPSLGARLAKETTVPASLVATPLRHGWTHRLCSMSAPKLSYGLQEKGGRGCRSKTSTSEFQGADSRRGSLHAHGGIRGLTVPPSGGKLPRLRTTLLFLPRALWLQKAFHRESAPRFIQLIVRISAFRTFAITSQWPNEEDSGYYFLYHWRCVFRVNSQKRHRLAKGYVCSLPGVIVTKRYTLCGT